MFQGAISYENFVNLTGQEIRVLEVTAAEFTSNHFKARKQHVTGLADFPPGERKAYFTEVTEEAKGFPKGCRDVVAAQIAGLPPPTPGTFFIVSEAILHAASIKGCRPDLFKPGPAVIDTECGKVLGYCGLSRLVES
jgi:hypothetical protein